MENSNEKKVAKKVNTKTTTKKNDSRKTIFLAGVFIVIFLIILLIYLLVFKGPSFTTTNSSSSNKNNNTTTAATKFNLNDKKTYGDYEFSDIKLNYSTDENDGITVFSMVAKNTSSSKKEEKQLVADFLDENGNALYSIAFLVGELESTSTYNISINLSGNTIAQVKNVEIRELQQ